MRALPFFLDIIGPFLLVVFVLTQILWPMLTRRKLFPLFSRDRAEAEDHVIDANERADIEAIWPKKDDSKIGDK